MRQTLRDRMVSAENQEVVVSTTGGDRIEGRLFEVGIDFVQVDTANGPIDIAIFQITTFRIR